MDMNTIEDLVHTADPADWRPGDAWLAGGTVLFSYGSETLRRLLDVTTAGWEPAAVGDDGIDLAASCTIAAVHALPDDPRIPTGRWPALELVRPCCDAFVASFKIWNLSTIGGNIATSLPAGPMTSLCAGLDGEALILSPGGSRRQPVAELVTGDARNTLADGELIRSIHLPAAALSATTAFRRLSLSERGRSGVLLIGRRDPGGGFVLTVTASTVRPVQLRFGAEALPGTRELDEALRETIPEDLYHRDIHGHPAWRRDMTHRLAEEIRGELFESKGA